MRLRLRTTLSLQLSILVLVMAFLVSIASRVLISRQFETYVTEQQKAEADEIANNVESQYGAAQDGWNIDYVHGMGMYALDEGFIIRLYDKEKQILWDAENHDMTLCHEVMESIRTRMQESQPEMQGDFVSHTYELKRQEEIVGYLDVDYYTPYYMNENDFQFVSALNRILLVIGLASLAAAVILGILLADRITEPLRNVVRVTKQISDGDYRARVDRSGRTQELYELTDAVNRMAASLSEQENLRRQLTSDVAHELRTPVANISSYVELMMEGVLEPTPERLQSCYNELKRLSALIRDLQRLEEEETAGIHLEKTETELTELAETVLKSFETRLQEKQIKAEITGERSVIHADRARLQQVLVNLISNAVKYTDEGGFIQIEIRDHADHSTICVADTGIGIPEEDLEKVFERFYRTDKSRNRKTGGAGIGLSIAKAVVQALGGTITCESENGKGRRFIVMLPK